MVFNGLFVAVTLLFLTPYLYNLPKATLAVIILLAVTSLITPKALKHTWQASKADGIVALVTFVVTLVAAPHLDKGIMIGAALAILLYLYRTMKPRVAILGRYGDGTLRDIKVNPNLATSKHVMAMRFDGSLYFANIAHFEDAVLEAVADHKEAKYLLVVGDAINQLDASGEEVVHHLVERLQRCRRDTGVLRAEKTGAGRDAQHRPVRSHRPEKYLRHRKSGAGLHLRTAGRRCGGRHALPGAAGASLILLGSKC